MTYSWDFGDGTTGTSKNPNHSYTMIGVYTVCLTITTTPTPPLQPCSSTTCKTVDLTDQCKFDFTYEEGSGGEVQFNVNPATIGNFYEWDFGDNNKAYTPNPKHTYKNAKTYNVCLTITNSLGCSTKVCKNVIVAKVCCDGKDKDKEKYLSWDNGNRRIKAKIWMSNLPYYHKFGAKTKNWKKKSNGNWKESKVDQIKSSAAGVLYDPDCGTPTPVNPAPQDNRNKDHARLTVGVGQAFKVRKNTLISEHYVRNGGASFSTNLYLTNDCD